MATILDFYRFASPRGITIKQLQTWTTTSTPTMTVSPGTSDVYFVKSIGVLMSSDADLGANTLRITHSADTFGGAESTQLNYTNVDELIAAFSPNTVASLSCHLKGHIVFDVPVRIDSPSETFTVSKVGTTAIAGRIDFCASGWYIDNDTDL